MKKVSQLLHRHEGNVPPSQAQATAAPVASARSLASSSGATNTAANSFTGQPGISMASTQPGTGLMGSSGSMLHPFASQYNLPPNVANWQQGQALPQGWRLGRKGYLKPSFVLPQQYSSWQQGQPLPSGYRLSKRGTLRPINYFDWWSSQSGGFSSGTQVFERTTVLERDIYQTQQAMSQVSVSAPVIEVREKPAVVQEVIKGTVREEIQPVIHREREQLEIREEVQPIYEKSIRPTIVEERSLAAEIKPEVRLGSMPVIAEGPKSSVFVEAEQREAFMHAPIVEEVVHKKIIEEVQPVIHREVFAPRVINERKDIYEKIIEAPVVTYSTLPPRYVGESSSGFTSVTTTTTTTSSTSMLHPFASQYNLPSQVANWQQGQQIPQGWRLGRQGYLKPSFVLPQQYSSWQQGQPLPSGYRLNKRGTLRPINYFDWWNSSNNMNKFQQQQQFSTGFAPSTIQQF